jgi:hypothetical protein
MRQLACVGRGLPVHSARAGKAGFVGPSPPSQHGDPHCWRLGGGLRCRDHGRAASRGTCSSSCAQNRTSFGARGLATRSNRFPQEEEDVAGGASVHGDLFDALWLVKRERGRALWVMRVRPVGLGADERDLSAPAGSRQATLIVKPTSASSRTANASNPDELEVEPDRRAPRWVRKVRCLHFSDAPGVLAVT